MSVVSYIVVTASASEHCNLPLPLELNAPLKKKKFGMVFVSFNISVYTQNIHNFDLPMMFYVWTEQAVAVAGGIIGGILLFVLLGITTYVLWKKICRVISYEKLINPVKTMNANAIFQDEANSETQLKSTRYVFSFRF